MNQLTPSNTTIGDLCTAALKRCGRLGTGQTATAQDMNDAWADCQWMLQEWERKRWLVYHLVTYSIVSTGAQSYTFGPGGQINTDRVAAWTLESLGPLSAQGGTGYAVYDLITLAGVAATSTPENALRVEVTAVSSGAVTAVSVDSHARGYVQFFANPIAGDTVTLNGVVWTFVAGAPGTNEVQILGTGELTVAAFATALNASTNAAVAEADYTVTGTIATADLKLNVFYATTGEEGNDYTLAASVATVSGANLTDGFTGEDTTIYPGPLPSMWTQSATTGSGFNAAFGFPVWKRSSETVGQPSGSVRPAKLEFAFVRQIQSPSPNQVDYPLQILQSKEDYDRIALKSMQSFPGAVFLDSAWPLGNLFCWPVPQASIYSINVTVREQLPASFASVATPINLPYEYYSAVMLNLALRLRVVFQIPSFPGDPLPGQAKAALATVRGPNTQIARLQMPSQLVRPGIYNIFSDRNY